MQVAARVLAQAFGHNLSRCETRLGDTNMALPFDHAGDVRDPRALAILARTLYRELRASGYAESDVMSLAGELLGIIASEVKGRRTVELGQTDA